MNDEILHEGVLIEEVIKFVAPSPGFAYIDCTLGGGGHFLKILKQLGPEGFVIGIDQDIQATTLVRKRIEQASHYPANYELVNGNFADLLPSIAQAQAHSLPVDCVLMDLGPSTPQLLSPFLGMSWKSDSALDMRLNPNAGLISASQIVNDWSAEELERIFREHAQERWSLRVAKRIAEKRQKEPILTGLRLGQIVEGAIPRGAWPKKIHPATRIFLALRIEVNREYENIDKALPAALDILRPGGKLLVISFHSGEDSRVKSFFRKMARPETEVPWPLPQKGIEGEPRLKIVTSRPVRPTEDEVRRNPRSRSARLRVARKV